MNRYCILTENVRRGAAQLLLELTPDGMAYIWPIEPSVQKVVLSSADDQDRDALLVDGDFLDKSGFYHSITDFKNYSKYSPRHYKYAEVGEFESIRSCRAALDIR